MRRVAMLILIALGLTLSTAPTIGAESARKAPPGFKTVKVKKAGFNIAIPKEWRTLNVTSKTADDFLENLKDAAPELANQLPPNVGALVEQNIVLMAFSDEDHEGFTANINVLWLPDESDLPTLEELAPSIRAIAEPGVGLTETTVAGEDAVRASYRIVSGEVSAQLLQYTFVGSRGVLAFTFTEGDGDTTRETFETMVESIKVLNR